MYTLIASRKELSSLQLQQITLPNLWELRSKLSGTSQWLVGWSWVLMVQLWEALGMLEEVVFLVTVLVIGPRVLPLNVEMDVAVLVYLLRNPMLFNLMLEPLLSNCWNLLRTSLILLWITSLEKPIGVPTIWLKLERHNL